MTKPVLTPTEEIALIQKNRGYIAIEPKEMWLNTGNRRLNAVLGSEELGIPYGKILEFFGPNSHGKTMLALLIAALAQKDGAKVGWVDLERSFDRPWVEAQGLKYDEVYPFKIQLVKSKDEEELRLQTIEEKLTEVEDWMKRRHAENRDGKLLVVVDSIAAMLVEDEADGGLTEQNMRTQMALPMFLSRLLRQWMGKAANYNAMIIFINQIRISPKRFGKKEYTPGGESHKFYAAVRAEVRRLSGKAGRMMQGSRVVGLRGILKNIKNKAGGGSVECAECGYETQFGKRAWRFPPVSEIRKFEKFNKEEAKGE